MECAVDTMGGSETALLRRPDPSGDLSWRSQVPSDQLYIDFTPVKQIEFRDIPGFPFYRASSDGFIWSLQTGSLRKLAASPVPPHGRLMVNLYRDGKKHPKYVHLLVLLAFKGPRPHGMEGCHGDGDFLNNSDGNLRWDSHANNILDKVKHGTMARGELNGRARLTRDQVEEIRKRYAAGQMQKEIAPAFGICKSLVGAICRGEIWSHLERT